MKKGMFSKFSSILQHAVDAVSLISKNPGAIVAFFGEVVDMQQG